MMIWIAPRNELGGLSSTCCKHAASPFVLSHIHAQTPADGGGRTCATVVTSVPSSCFIGTANGRTAPTSPTNLPAILLASHCWTAVQLVGAPLAALHTTVSCSRAASKKCSRSPRRLPSGI